MQSLGILARRHRARRLQTRNDPSASRTAPPAAYVRRFEACFALVYGALRTRCDEAEAQRLTAEVLREHLDLLVPRRDAADGAPSLRKEEAQRLLADVRARCGAEDQPRRRVR